MAIVIVGIDLAKNVFALHKVDESGKPAGCVGSLICYQFNSCRLPYLKGKLAFLFTSNVDNIAETLKKPKLKQKIGSSPLWHGRHQLSNKANTTDHRITATRPLVEKPAVVRALAVQSAQGPPSPPACAGRQDSHARC